MRLMAHRGGSGLRMENTLAAFAHAIELGVAGAELDVHLSCDGEVVVHHNDTLNPAYCRDTPTHWIEPAQALPLTALTGAQLRAYDISQPRPQSNYARAFPRLQPVPGQHIPLLADVIALAQDRSPDFVLVIEIKTPMLTAAQRNWIALVDATLDVINAAHFAERSILCSFDWGALRYAMSRQPGLVTWFTSAPLSWLAAGQPPASDIPPSPATLHALRAAWATGEAPWFGGFDPRRFGGSRPQAVAAAGGNAWFPFHRDFTRATAAALARVGLTGAAWSVNLRDEAELARLAASGVDALVIDYPDWRAH